MQLSKVICRTRIILCGFSMACVWWGGELPAESPRPNVLLIVSDDLSAEALGCYGNEVCETPNIDRLASEGVRFDRAYCQYPVCAASRASFMSGLYPETTGILRNDKRLGSYRAVTPELRDHPSIGGFLRRNGYVSLRVSKIYHMGVPGGIEAGEPGGDDPDSWDRAYDVMAPETSSYGDLLSLSPRRRHYGSNFVKIEIPDETQETQADHLSVSHAIAILENRVRFRNPTANFLEPQEPFFLAVGLVRPHVPLVAPRRLFEQYPPEEMTLPEVPEGDLDDLPRRARIGENERSFGMSEAQAREALAAYYASTTFMDEQVGRLLAALERLEVRERTLVIFMSDHGWNLGEHGVWQKSNLWEESRRVPLIISAPGAARGQSSEALVELVDLYPTVADWCGLLDAAPERLQGMSLKPLLEDPGRGDWPRKYAYTVTSGGEAGAIRAESWRYASWPDGEEFYDLERDPGEFRNEASNPEYATRIESAREAIDRVAALAGGR